MAGGQERVLRRRIKSVQSTRKITKAMELIAASQILARPGAHRRQPPLPRRHAAHHRRRPPWATRPPRRSCSATPEHVSTRPSCSSSPATAGCRAPTTRRSLRAGERLVAKLEGERARACASSASARRRRAYFRFRGIDVERQLRGLLRPPDLRRRAAQVAERVAAPFVDGDAHQVLLVSTRFLSAGEPGRRAPPAAAAPVPEARPRTTRRRRCKGYTEFEPEVEQLLTTLAPRALESEIFTALLEGAASLPHQPAARDGRRHRERRRARARPSPRVMNRARQDSITTEIMEIVGGAEALRPGK